MLLPLLDPEKMPGINEVLKQLGCQRRLDICDNVSVNKQEAELVDAPDRYYRGQAIIGEVKNFFAKFAGN